MTESTRLLQSDILELIGAIILSTQDAEKYLKALLPFLKPKDPSFGAALSRLDKLKKRTLGELIGKFVDSSTFASSDFVRQLDSLVDQRNQIVHHFNETYGERLGSGKSKDVVAALRAQLSNVNAFRDGLAQIALHLLEAMRDTVFQDTPEHQAMAKLCAALRQQAAS